MQKPKNTSRLLIGTFIAVIFLPSICQYVMELGFNGTPYVLELFAEEPTAANLRIFEKNLEDRSWISRQIRPVAQYAMYYGLHDCGDKALPGKDNWLYYAPDVTYLVEPWPKAPAKDAQSSDAFRAIVAFHDELRALGIELMVMPVPVRPRVFPEKLSATCERSHAEDLIDALDAAGIVTVNLFPLFDKAKQDSPNAQLYLTQDTHWGPHGIKLAAEAVANRLTELGWARRGNTEYVLTPKIFKRQGDVWNLIKVPTANMDIPPESIACERLTDAASGELVKPVQSSDILVIGDSFVGIFEDDDFRRTDEFTSSGFPSHLAYAMKRPIALLTRFGGASTLVRRLLAQKPKLLFGKKVIVWEFIERDLSNGTEGWQIVKLPRPSGPEGEMHH